MAKNEIKYTREALLRAEEFSNVQPDFLSVLLCEPEYTLAEAQAIVDNYFGKKEIGGEE